MLRATPVVLLLLGAADFAAAADKPPVCQQTFACAAGACRLEVQFPAADKCTVRIDDAFIRTAKATRITEETVLRIRVLHANLLRYKLTFDTKETVIETYVALEKLWKQILGLGTLVGATPGTLAATADKDREQAFVDAINEWRTQIDTKNGALSTFLNTLTPLILDAAAEAKIKTERDTNVPANVKALEDARTKARVAMWRSENFAIYDATLASHQATLDRYDSFLVLADQSLNGIDKRITFGQAGRVVAVTVTPTDRSTGKDATQVIGVEFLVHSTLPVTFHAGFSVRAIDEVKFQPVASALATAGGADLFTKVQDTTSNSTFTAFMSYRVCSANGVNRGCPHLTIGTDFKDVGERLYGGVSWAIGRTFLTVGLVNGETVEGTGAVTEILEAAGQVTGSRELFTAIGTKRKWGGFVGISFTPF
jgi:hypothetical protein